MTIHTVNKGERLDLPEISETYADFVIQTYFDSHNFRIELGISRFDPETYGPDKESMDKRYTACRLVMPPSAVLNLVDQLQDLLGSLDKEGILIRGHAHAPPSKVQ